MLDKEDLDGLIRSEASVVGVGGETIGGLGQIYMDDATDRPSWATVATGLFGRHESFFPLDGARIEGRSIVIPFSKALVRDAPRIEPEGELEPDEQDRLYRHYQRDGGLQTYSASRGLPGTGPDAMPGRPDTGLSRLRRYVGTGEQPADTPLKDDPAERGPETHDGTETPQ